MSTAFLYENFLVNIIYRNDDLFSGWNFCSHVDAQFGITIAFDHSLDVIDIFCFKSRKCFFDFKDIFDIATYHESLYIQFVQTSISLR